MRYFKAVRYDYGSFYNPAFKYGPVGTIVTHPNYQSEDESATAAGYISVSTSEADCTGFEWRVDSKVSRLLVVEPIGDIYTPNRYNLPNKRAVRAVRVADELPADRLFGPNGEAVVAYLESLHALTTSRWAAAWAAAWDAAWDAARHAAGAAARHAAGAAARVAAWDAAWDAAGAAGVAAWDAARVAARVAAEDAALGLIVADKITAEQFDILTTPMRAAGLNFAALAGGKN